MTSSDEPHPSEDHDEEDPHTSEIAVDGLICECGRVLPYPPGTPPTVIDYDEFREAQKDIRVMALLSTAKIVGARMERKGEHPLTRRSIP